MTEINTNSYYLYIEGESLDCLNMDNMHTKIYDFFSEEDNLINILSKLNRNYIYIDVNSLDGNKYPGIKAKYSNNLFFKLTPTGTDITWKGPGVDIFMALDTAKNQKKILIILPDFGLLRNLKIIPSLIPEIKNNSTWQVPLIETKQFDWLSDFPNNMAICAKDGFVINQPELPKNPQNTADIGF